MAPTHPEKVDGEMDCEESPTESQRMPDLKKSDLTADRERSATPAAKWRDMPGETGAALVEFAGELTERLNTDACSRFVAQFARVDWPSKWIDEESGAT